MSLRTVRIGAFLAIMALGASAFGATNAFGPKSYPNTNGNPQTVDDAFAVDLSETCDGMATFVLTVEDSGVKSAIVAFNGTTLLRESDFPGASVRELLVTASASNHLTVTIKGGSAGSALRITLQRRIEQTVMGPKTLTIDRGQATDTASFVAETGGIYTLLLRNGGVSN